MNKGGEYVSGNFIHYLNAGDQVFGKPYENISAACTLDVYIKSEDNSILGRDREVVLGLGYIHQGIIFPAKHAKYNLSLDIAADFDLVLKTFPEGIKNVKRNTDSYIVYGYGGVSSTKRLERDNQILKILLSHNKLFTYLTFFIFSRFKLFFPIKVIRKFKKLFLTVRG
jgi:hypothetical protein